MNILRDSLGVNKITPGKMEKRDSMLPPDPKVGSELLSTFWNWCVLDGCRAILKSGRLFAKEHAMGQYVYSRPFFVSISDLTFRV